MRTSLDATQWHRLRGHVSELSAEQRAELLHRIEVRKEVAAIDLAMIAMGKDLKKVKGNPQALSDEILYQVADWLRKK